jgi:predicted nucleic acid-binding protein
MTGYLDSSVLLRVLLNQPKKLKDFSKLDRPVSSKLLKAESLRALDRCRITQALDETEFVTAGAELYQHLDAVEFIEISDSILEKTGGSFSVAIGTLDAIHLSSALAWREFFGQDLLFLTHDKILSTAAQTLGFKVLGA